MERKVRIRFPGPASTSRILENSRRGNVMYIYIKYGFSRNSMLPVAWRKRAWFKRGIIRPDPMTRKTQRRDILACTWNLELLFDVRKRNKLNFRRCFFFSLSSFPPGISESFIKLFDLLKLRDVILIAVQKEFYNSLQLEICLSSISILRFFGEIYI